MHLTECPVGAERKKGLAMMVASPFNRWAMGWENGGTKNHPTALGALTAREVMALSYGVCRSEKRDDVLMAAG